MINTENVRAESGPSMLTTVKQDWELMDALPPALPSEELSLDTLTEVIDVLESRYKGIRASEEKHPEDEARLAFWLGSLQFDRARHPGTPDEWRGEYFDDGLDYLNRVRTSEDVSLSRRHQAALLGTSRRMHMLHIADEEPTDAQLARYAKHISEASLLIRRDTKKTKQAKTEPLMDAGLPALLASEDLVPFIANARERGDIPVPHPTLDARTHQQYLMDGEQKIAIKAVFHGVDGRANSIPGELVYICMHSLAKYHTKMNHPELFNHLESVRKTGAISYNVMTWVLRAASKRNLLRPEALTLSAVANDIMDRIFEVAPERPGTTSS